MSEAIQFHKDGFQNHSVSDKYIVRMSQDDIKFGVVHQLEVSCDEMTETSVADVNVIFIDGSSSTATSPTFTDKAYLSIHLVTTMTLILRWDQFLN